jgi:hypothetical protein
MRAVVAGLTLAALLTGCASGSSAPTVGRTGSPTLRPTSAPPPTELAGAGCPVEDGGFCARALVAANALLAGDSEGLLSVSAVETFRCDEMPAGIVPACRPGAVLTGHGVFAVESRISVVPAADYPGWLDELLDRVVPGFSDDRGPGRAVVLGVGTCGPPDPERRSYHLAFTVALAGKADPTGRRWLGSFEFVRRAGRWVTALLYLDTVESWRKEHSDPFRDFACGNIRPWPAG